MGSSPSGRHPDGRMRFLHGLGRHHHVLQRVALADEVDLLLRPRPAQDLDALLEERDPIAHLEPVGREVALLVALADAQDEAAAGDDVDDRAVLGQARGMIEGQDGDARCRSGWSRCGRRWPRPGGAATGSSPAGSWWCSVRKNESKPTRSAGWASAISSSTIRGRSVPGAGCELAITPNWIIASPVEARRSLREALVEQPARLALAAVGERGQAARGPTSSTVTRIPRSDLSRSSRMWTRASRVARALLGLHLHRHVVADVEALRPAARPRTATRRWCGRRRSPRRTQAMGNTLVPRIFTMSSLRPRKWSILRVELPHPQRGPPVRDDAARSRAGCSGSGAGGGGRGWS